MAYICECVGQFLTCKFAKNKWFLRSLFTWIVSVSVSKSWIQLRCILIKWVIPFHIEQITYFLQPFYRTLMNPQITANQVESANHWPELSGEFWWKLKFWLACRCCMILSNEKIVFILQKIVHVLFFRVVDKFHCVIFVCFTVWSHENRRSCVSMYCLHLINF